VNDQNEVRLPVVKFLASQRASSIQTLVTYFIAVRLVLINRISLQHCQPVDYVQEPNEALASSRRKLLGETGMSSYCGLLIGIGSPRLEPLSSASRALWPGGSAFAAQGSGCPPRPGALGGVPVIPRKIWSGPVLPPPKFPGVAMESCLPFPRSADGAPVHKGGGSRIASRRTTSFCTSGCFCGHHMWVDRT
jgi:hypothetical protein